MSAIRKMPQKSKAVVIIISFVYFPVGWDP
jgi:hypothetical protein